MSKKKGLPNSVKFKHDHHIVDEIVTRTKTPIIRNIPLNKLIPNIMQPRKEVGNLEELANSIKEKGVLEPLLVRPRNGQFEIIAGERRFQASKEADLMEIPCIEYDVPDNEALELSIVENLQRKDLGYFETAFSFKTLNEIYGYTHEEISQKIGKSRVTISELIRLTDLPVDIIKKCQDLNISSKTFLLELVKLGSKDKMLEVLKAYAENSFSRDEIKRKRKKEKKGEKGQDPGQLKFRFASEDKRININFNLKDKDVNRDQIIDILQRLIEDIKNNKIKELTI